MDLHQTTNCSPQQFYAPVHPSMLNTPYKHAYAASCAPYSNPLPQITTPSPHLQSSVSPISQAESRGPENTNRHCTVCVPQCSSHQCASSTVPRWVLHGSATLMYTTALHSFSPGGSKNLEPAAYTPPRHSTAQHAMALHSSSKPGVGSPLALETNCTSPKHPRRRARRASQGTIPFVACNTNSMDDCCCTSAL